MKGQLRTPGQKKRHHYVPRCLLKRFTNDDGRFWLYRKRVAQDGIISAHPDSDFFQTHFYSRYLEDGTRDTALEETFAQRETVWNQALDRFIDASGRQRPADVGGELRKQIADFIYYQWIRTPIFLDLVATEDDVRRKISSLVLEFEAEGREISDEDQERLLAPASIRRIRQNTIVDHLLGETRFEPQTRRAINQHGFRVVTLQAGYTPFVIGSFPIVNVPSPGALLNGGRREMWMPLSSWNAVFPLFGMARGPSSGMHQSHVDTINRGIFAQSDVIACADREVLETLVATDGVARPAG